MYFLQLQFFSFLCYYSSHMSEYTGQKSEAFRYLFKRISLLSCFFMFIFLLFFSFLLIGEKVNTQWLSHAIFDPVVSWSYFLSFVLFHDFFLFSLFVLLVSVCVLLWLWWREWWWLGDFEGVVEVGLDWFGNCGSCLSKFHVFAIACVWVYFVWMFCYFAQ